MKLNIKNPIIFFDIESTGLDVSKDRIIELCYIKILPNGNEEAKNIRLAENETRNAFILRQWRELSARPPETVAATASGEVEERHISLLNQGRWGDYVDDPQAANDLIRRVRENHNGMTDCRDLLRVNAENGGEKMPHCNAMIRECIGYAEEILKAKGRL